MNPKNMKNLLKLMLSNDTENTAGQQSSNKPISKTSGHSITKGQMLNRYLIVEELGRGGMGVVYKAVDQKLHREVAIKVLQKDQSDNLLKEARSIAQLHHPNIVQMFEIFEHPTSFITMELIRGISLHSFIQQHKNKPKNKEYFHKITTIFIEIASALHFAHKKNIIHRDIKSENVMLDGNSKPKIMDFGLAQKG